MKDKTLHLTISRYDIIGAQHWYVMSLDCSIHRKYDVFNDAWEYAKSIAYVKNIEVFD